MTMKLILTVDVSLDCRFPVCGGSRGEPMNVVLAHGSQPTVLMGHFDA